MENTLLSNGYMAIKELGSGSFGDVFMAESKEFGNVALKVENSKESSRLISEFKIYKRLSKLGENPVKVYQLLRTPQYNIMSMELLGDSLDDIFNKNGKKFPIQFVLYIGMQMINIIEIVHKAGYLHRDIKPGNFLIRPSTKEVCVIDFGLSKRYLDNDGNHIELRTGRSLVGTARYASINIHLGFEPSRRDDLESIGYVLLYFAIGRLPWQGLKGGGKKASLKLIGNRKITTSINILCDGYPACLKEIVNYTRELSFDEVPNYEYLRGLIKKDIMDAQK